MSVLYFEGTEKVKVNVEMPSEQIERNNLDSTLALDTLNTTPVTTDTDFDMQTESLW